MEINKIADKLYKILENCTLCPHACRINRKTGSSGYCGMGYEPMVSSTMPHYGEEPPISGTMGSGTIFFSGCNMRCVYCQNYQISQERDGELITVEHLADLMLTVERMGCHNINLVSPSIWTPQIIEALAIAEKRGLSIPVVYNTGGYDDPDIIRILEGAIDVYMPDLRYSNNEMAKKYSGINNYVENSRNSVIEMYRQVGGLKLNSEGIAERGLLIRLLVLPNDTGGVKETLNFIKDNLSTDVFLSIMAQYNPVYSADKYPEISRGIFKSEYIEVIEMAERLGFDMGWTQDYVSLKNENDMFIPDFNDRDVFKYNKNKNRKKDS